jgi:hypothetical protein
MHPRRAAVAAAPQRAFDRRVATLLGVPVPVAQRFTAAARLRLPPHGYWLRAAAFLLATMSLAPKLLPHGARRRAIRSMVGPMIETPSLNALYIGEDPPRCGASERT